ncbi:MAG: hypothetical protein KIT22_15575 [Verrucomicrobiae bacterium]|nr:hypothetical protein [Verrucomicrobiae bacterium]
MKRIAVLLASLAVLLLPSNARPGIILNEDNSHFFTSRTAEAMTLEGLHAFLDQYADTKVTHLFLCPNSMKASFKSVTREAIWELGDQKMPEGAGKRWMDNARVLHERGLDPYAIWIARARAKGLSPWLSMRMNDVHDVSDPSSYMHSSFWVKHPEFWRVPKDTSGGWTARALDYGRPEVRAHAMDFVKELLERYDPDGIELDWMRFGWHFREGEEAAGAELLTRFMREVRDLARTWSAKRGRVIQVAARLPAHPDAAQGLGMDGVRWAREGLVDLLVPCPFWTSSDFDIPVELWRERLGVKGAGVKLAPGLEFNSRAWPGDAPVANDLASTRRFAASAWHRGADRIYLFNYMDSETIPVSAHDYRILLEQGLGRDVVFHQPRRHLQCFHDTVPAGFPNGVALPAEGPEASFTLHIGPKPSAGTLRFVIGLSQKAGVAEAVCTASVNGAAPIPAGAADLENPGRFPGTIRALAFDCPLEEVRDGVNTFTVRLPAGQRIVWAEVQVEPRPE